MYISTCIFASFNFLFKVLCAKIIILKFQRSKDPNNCKKVYRFLYKYKYTYILIYI